MSSCVLDQLTTFNHGVVGSSPTALTKNINDINQLWHAAIGDLTLICRLGPLGDPFSLGGNYDGEPMTRNSLPQQLSISACSNHLSSPASQRAGPRSPPVDGISDFDGLHSRRHDDEVQFYAFDILVDGGDDLRKLPLHLRKNNLSRLLARRVDGISFPTSKAWSRSAGKAPTAPAGRRTGLRSRTASIPRCTGLWRRSHEWPETATMTARQQKITLGGNAGLWPFPGPWCTAKRLLLPFRSISTHLTQIELFST
jgi:hypothetical protein